MFSLKWHKRFMEIATLVSSWSKDESTKVGAVVVGIDKEIRATGYNGIVRGVDDDVEERSQRPTKYEFYEHAERNAIYNACLTGVSLKGCAIYVTYFPCTDCARAIIQTGIKLVLTNKKIDSKIVANSDWRENLDYSRQMFKEAGVEFLEL